jgi:predicted dehydrogenase
LDLLQSAGLAPSFVGDLEAVLADPNVDAVIVASPISTRPAVLRRALQSERHVLCVHPADATPDTAFEAAMIQGDTGHVLLPILADGLHPAITRLAEEIGHLGELRLLDCRLAAATSLLIESEPPAWPFWPVLRAIGGEIADVSALTSRAEIESDRAMLLSGRFHNGALFQVALLPGSSERTWRFMLTGPTGHAEVAFPEGWDGPSRLTAQSATVSLDLDWPAWDWGPTVVAAFDAALAKNDNRLSWQDEIRCLELDDAARRSVHHRRVSALEHLDASEEVGFKGTMTLVGCGLLWGTLLVLILSRTFPSRIWWLIVPVLFLFLALQLLRWLIPKESSPPHSEGPRETK